jgi:hypothetical protein
LTTKGVAGSSRLFTSECRTEPLYLLIPFCLLIRYPKILPG